MIRRTPPVHAAASSVQREPSRRPYRPPVSSRPSVEAHPASLPASPSRRLAERGWLAALIAVLTGHPAPGSPAGVTVEPRWHPRHLAAGSTAARSPRVAPAETGRHAADVPDGAGALDRLAASVTMIVAAALALAVSVVVAPRLRDAAPAANAEPSALAMQGAAIYGTTCAGCHGGDLKGGAANGAAAGLQPPPLDASGHAWLHSDATLFRMVKFGIANCLGTAGPSQMPSFGDRLDDRSIRAVIAFVKSRWPNDFRIVQNAFNDGESDTAESQEAVLCAAICAPPAPRASAEPSVAAR